MKAALAFVLALALPGFVPPALASVDIAELDGTAPGAPTQVAVLGSSHLSQLPDSFKAESLEPLLERLQAFHPDVIAIEALSGESCELLATYSSLYPGASDYCSVPQTARKSTGLDAVASITQVHAAFAAWPSAPTAAQRRHLAALLASANEPASAVVQWLQLPVAERRPGDGIDEALATLLDKLSHTRNENYLIGAALAARLGLQRVHAVDDHTADSVQGNAGSGLEAAMRAIWSASSFPYMKQAQALEQGSDMLALYRFQNRPEVLRSAIAGDFGAALKDPSPEHYGRQYVAWWETRNLRMVANIRAASGNRPGGKVLVIVGASHKPYFDAYLGLMHDMAVVDVTELLGK